MNLGNSFVPNSGIIELIIRFYGDLNDFLLPNRKQVRFTHVIKEPASVKDVIEALGVPHPEVELILVNGKSVDFSFLVNEEVQIAVYPRFRILDISPVSQVTPHPLKNYRFVVDVHLGKLSNYLRLFGFDALYQNNFEDEQLANLSAQEQRILLTQDRALLKRSLITHGYCVRSSDPLQQLVEVLQRFDLWEAITLFRRCIRCNGLLQTVSKDEISDRLPPFTRLNYHEFSRCQDCHKLYWQGAHYHRIQTLIDEVERQKHRYDGCASEDKRASADGVDSEAKDFTIRTEQGA